MADLTARAQPTNARARRGEISLGGGAQFWAFVSPHNDTIDHVTSWSVQIDEAEGSWSATITSEDPQAIVQAPGRGGTFEVTVTASGPAFSDLSLQPLPDSTPHITCAEDGAAMIGLVANEDGTDALFWTVGNALGPDDM